MIETRLFIEEQILKFFVATLLVFIASGCVSGCVSGPKPADHSVAKDLNGENYQSGKLIMGVPVLERAPIQRKVSGRVFCGEGLSRFPVNYASVRFQRAKQTIASTSTDADGRYVITIATDPNGNFELLASAKCGRASQKITHHLDTNPLEMNFDLKP